MRKMLLTGLASLALVACSSGFQTNKTERQTILRSKFNQDLPQWVLDSMDSQIIEENGKTYYISNIERSERSNNTAQLERAASLNAASQLAHMAASKINSVIQANAEGENVRGESSSMKQISETSVKISTIIPVSTYWQLVEFPDNGERKYYAWAKVRVDSQEIVNAMATAFVKENPGVKSGVAKDIISQSAESMNLGDIKPNNKIF
ncbi:MAG: hypothetical protein K6B71_01660 [Alphaproteobacteria bacterium]|nr:hypothetical protein [Alphaproteobacteria bacterium]